MRARIQHHRGKVREGDTIQLQCRATGYPKPTTSWMKDGKALETGDRVRIYGNKLVVTRASIDDSGIYTCRAGNGRQQAKDTTTVQVSIPGKPALCEVPCTRLLVVRWTTRTTRLCLS